MCSSSFQSQPTATFAKHRAAEPSCKLSVQADTCTQIHRRTPLPWQRPHPRSTLTRAWAAHRVYSAAAFASCRRHCSVAATILQSASDRVPQLSRGGKSIGSTIRMQMPDW